MCDCGDDGVCGIVVICSLQYLCVIVVCILENVSPSLSFEHDVRTFFLGGQYRKQGRRGRERESPRWVEFVVRRGRVWLSRFGRIRWCFRGTIRWTFVSDCGDGSHFNVLVVAISLSLSIFQWLSLSISLDLDTMMFSNLLKFLVSYCHSCM